MPTTYLWDGAATGTGANQPTGPNWSGTGIPTTGDSCVFPALLGSTSINVTGSTAGTGGLAPIALVNLACEPGNTMVFGSRTLPVGFDADYIDWAGSGGGNLKVNNSTRMEVFGGRAADTGYAFGMSLAGAGNAYLRVDVGAGNTFGIVAEAGATGSFTNIDAVSGNLTIGSALTCSGALSILGAAVHNNSDVTAANVNAGTLWQELNKPTTLNLYSGRVYYNSTGAPTTVNLYGGVLDMSKDGRAKTFAAVNLWPGASISDPAKVLTITTLALQDGGTLQLS